MRFELFVAARYLRAKRRQAVVGVVTGISVVGVAAGVASLVIALAITNGMRRDLQERLVGATAHVELMRVAGDGIRGWQGLLERVGEVPGVVAAAPGLYGQVLISRGARSGGALIKGIVPEQERRVGDLLQAVTVGSADELGVRDPGSGIRVEPGAKVRGSGFGGRVASHPELEDGGRGQGSGGQVEGGNMLATPPLVIGKDLATAIGAGVGDAVWVTSPQGELTPLGVVPKFARFRVVGIFSSGFYQYDSTYGLMRLGDAQRLFSEPDLISVISFRVKDLYKAAEVGRRIEQVAGAGFQTTNWMEQNRELFRALRLEQVVTFIVLALIVCVAALNILIALTMMVMEKTRDIAVMMSYGVTAGQVRRIFLLQGLLISVVGTVAGLVVGYGVSWAGGHYRFVPLDASVYSIDHLPFAPRVVDALIVAAVSLGVSLLATLYPSGSAAGVLPAEALRYE